MASENRPTKRGISGSVCDQMPYSAREAFKRLRTNILLAFGDEETDKICRVIGVTSAQVAEGKSTVSINLAYSLAELGKSVFLIDGDMRRPSIHEKLNCPMEPGLGEVLMGDVDINTVITEYKSTTGKISFRVITGGEIPENPSELLNSGRFQKLVQVVSTACDYVIIDLPPVNAVVDAVNVAGCTDGMLVVIREDHCPRFVLEECMSQLKYAKANVLGFVMNGCVEGSAKRYHYNKQYYYRK